MGFINIYNRLKGSDLAKDSFWALFGNFIGKGLSLIAGIAVARFLGSEVYGEYGIIKSTLIMIAIFSSFGLGITATKFIAETKDKNPENFYMEYVTPLNVDLTSLEHYPSIEISKDDLL